VEKRERTTRRKRWETQDEDEVYSAKQLDRDIVNPDQIRTVIRAFKDSLPTLFPGRKEVPKTLIFAKTDSHADDIVQTVREEFGECNQFCKKVTYRVAKDKTDAGGKVIEKGEDPKSVLSQFRNDYYPRIAVTVDMIATGTDVKPLECLLFMRDVKSKNYFEQMKGRGTRTLDKDSLQKVTPSAKTAKTHYVIVDAIGVTKSVKTASQPLITKPSVPLKDLAMGVMMGASDTDTVSSLAGRLARLDKQLDDKERARIAEKAGGTPLLVIVGELFNAIDGDRVEEKALEIAGVPPGTDPGDDARNQAQKELVSQAANVFNGELIELIDSIRRDKEQTIVHDDLDEVIRADRRQRPGAGTGICRLPARAGGSDRRPDHLLQNARPAFRGDLFPDQIPAGNPEAGPTQTGAPAHLAGLCPSGQLPGRQPPDRTDGSGGTDPPCLRHRHDPDPLQQYRKKKLSGLDYEIPRRWQ
jgi:type I restriction enzyme R subunit